MEKKHWILIAVIVVVAVVAFLLWPRKKNMPVPPPEPAPGPTGPQVSPVEQAVTGGGATSPVAATLTQQQQLGVLGALGSPLGILTTGGGLLSGSGNSGGNTAYALGGAGTSNIATGAAGIANSILKKFPLKQGSKGEEVKKVQKYINLVYRSVKGGKKDLVAVDGAWGPKTTNALKMVLTNPATGQALTTITAEMYINQILPSIK